MSGGQGSRCCILSWPSSSIHTLSKPSRRSRRNLASRRCLWIIPDHLEMVVTPVNGPKIIMIVDGFQSHLPDQVISHITRLLSTTINRKLSTKNTETVERERESTATSNRFCLKETLHNQSITPPYRSWSLFMSHDDQRGMSCCCSVTVSIINLASRGGEKRGEGGRVEDQGHLLPILPPFTSLALDRNATP